MDIVKLLATPPLKRSELASRAGISRNTEWTIRHDQSRAHLGTLRELALACGYDIEVQLSPGFDPMASAAARVLLGDLAEENVQGMAEWRDRILRYTDFQGDSTQLEKIAIAQEAAIFSGAQNAPKAVMLAGRSDVLRLTSAAMAANLALKETPALAIEQGSNHEWMLSGWAGLRSEDSSEEASKSLPTVVWTTHPQLFALQLQSSHRRVETMRAADVVVAPVSSHQRIGTREVEAALLVSGVQAIIDCMGLGGPIAELALAKAREW